MRRALALVLAGLSAVAVVTPCRAQDELRHLLELNGRRSRAWYTTGALDRAAHAQTRFESVVVEVSDALGRPIVIELWLLGREEWAAAGLSRPYGMPQGYGAGLALPAHGDEGTVALWRTVLGGQLPGPGGVPLRGSPDEVASLGLADLVGTFELCRRLVAQAGVVGDEPWLPELAAATLARGILLKLEPGRAAEIDQVVDALTALGPERPPALGPSQVDALGPTAWLGQIGRHAAGGGVVVAAEGWRAGRKVLKPARRGRPLEAAGLLDDYPGLGSWFEEWFGPAATTSQSRLGEKVRLVTRPGSPAPAGAAGPAGADPSVAGRAPRRAPPTERSPGPRDRSAA